MVAMLPSARWSSIAQGSLHSDGRRGGTGVVRGAQRSPVITENLVADVEAAVA